MKVPQILDWQLGDSAENYEGDAACLMCSIFVLTMAWFKTPNKNKTFEVFTIRSFNDGP